MSIVIITLKILIVGAVLGAALYFIGRTLAPLFVKKKTKNVEMTAESQEMALAELIKLADELFVQHSDRKDGLSELNRLITLTRLHFDPKSEDELSNKLTEFHRELFSGDKDKIGYFYRLHRETIIREAKRCTQT